MSSVALSSISIDSINVSTTIPSVSSADETIGKIKINSLFGSDTEIDRSLSRLNKDQIVRIRPDDFKLLKKKIAEFTPIQIGYLTDSQITSLTSEQIEALSNDQISIFDDRQATVNFELHHVKLTR